MLAGRVVTAGALLIGAKFFGRLIDFAALLVLARLLTPDDFGIVAAAMTLVSILEVVLELPVGLVLVRTPDPEPSHYDTAFTLSVLRGATVGLFVAGIAWPYAWLFGDARLVPVILCLGWAPMIRGCVSPCLSAYTRGLRLGPDCCVQMVGKLGAFVAAMAVVAAERNYWALVAATVTSPTVMVMTSYAVAPYRPRFSLKQWRIFWDFLGWLGGTQVLAALSWQCDRLILGQMTGRAELGRYTMADTLSALPIQALAVPIAAILFPALDSINTERERLRRGFLMSLNAVYTLCLPIMVGLVVLADPICRTVLGEQWIGVVHALQVLGVASALGLIAQPLGSLLYALGRTKLGLTRTAAGLAIKLPLMVAGGLEFGLSGVVYARLATECVMFGVSLSNIRQATGASVSSILLSLARPAAGVAAMAFALVLFEPVLGLGATPATRILSLGLLATAGGVVYAAVVLALWALADCPAGVEAKLASVARRCWQQVRGRERARLLPGEAAVARAQGGSHPS